MKVRTFAGISLVAAAGIIAMPTLKATPAKSPVQASRITFLEPTRVCGHFLMGDYVVVHDDLKMARGEPCTTFYQLKRDKTEPVLSFHCIPRQRDVVAQTTIRIVPADGVTTMTRWRKLVEYQIGGDSEAHGVPEFDVHEGR